MDILAAETALANRAAVWLNLAIDVEMFRGEIPENLPRAAAVAVTGVEPAITAALKNASAMLTVECVGRAGLLALLDDVLAALPDYGCPGITAVLPYGEAALVPAQEGVDRWRFTMALKLNGF